MISLDVFDTAIFRKVYKPTDLFKIINDEEFYNKRIEAQERAAKLDPYYSLDDIYKFLPEYDKNIEIEAEINSSEANPKILELYNTNSEKFVFISDMYLDSKDIARILEHAGYKDPRVFVSQELKAYKGDGRAFKLVQELIQEDICTHYGDDYIADIRGAKRAGIDAIFSPSMRNMNLDLPEVNDSYLLNYVARNLCREYMYSNIEIIKTITRIMVPILVDFVRWVVSNRDDESKQLIFLARDMKLPYLIARDIFKVKNISYMFISRRSVEAVIRESEDEVFNQKLDLIDNEDVCKVEEIRKYIDQFNIKDGDYIVDIGYCGTAQFALQRLLDIKLKGLYMQKDPNQHPELDIAMYFNRMAIKFPLLVESFLASNEDCLRGYKDGEPIFKPDNELRKQLASIAQKSLLEVFTEYSELIDKKFSLFDLEQVLIYLQLYCPDEFLDLYNAPIIQNRVSEESIINYNKEEIYKGELFNLYQHSYAKHLFLRMLRKDRELSHLERLLT